MVKVITYGTYDLLHYGHIRLLERAKELGDYLIVGVTSDDYDKTRGKINNRQSLMERVMAVEQTGIVDEVIVEEYDGQKIDDIQRLDVDIFAIGSDWEGKFDYLSDYCKVVYLPRTEGISSSEIRAKNTNIRIGLVGDRGSELTSLSKFMREVSFVNGVNPVCSNCEIEGLEQVDDFNDILKRVDALYIASHPSKHYRQIADAFLAGKHVLCESPVAIQLTQFDELVKTATEKNLVLMDGIKTAYTTAFERLVLLTKTGRIGEIISVDATCTSIKNIANYSENDFSANWNTMTEWGPPALLAVFKVLGCDYEDIRIVTKTERDHPDFDLFTKVDFIYPGAVASIKLAKGVKSEGELVISGTRGYIFVPAPWWKTDYFEIRYENQTENQRFFYQLDGEGIRYEIAAFAKAIENHNYSLYLSSTISRKISEVIEMYYAKKNVSLLK